MQYKINKGDKQESMVITPKENESVRLSFNGFKRNGEWIDLRMQINYVQDENIYYAQMYARDEVGYFSDLKLEVEFEKLDLSRSAEDRLGLVYKDES